MEDPDQKAGTVLTEDMFETMKSGSDRDKQSLCSLEDLAERRIISHQNAKYLADIGERYAVRIPRGLTGRIAAAGGRGPLARQYVPSRRERITDRLENEDPIGDRIWSPIKGIVHRYPDRVLLKAIQTCPVYCRFCFRRAFVGPGRGILKPKELAAALAYIRNHREIWEVILTGGDPLMLSPRRLSMIVSALDAMAHVAVIRFHSRVPVAEPGRITARTIDALKRRNGPVYIAIHANHPDEFDSSACRACDRLTEAGISLLGQSVLLKGVNDHADILESLFRVMVRNRIKPYYLHHLDHAPGTSHFRVGIAEGQDLMRRLRGRVSGLCQPTYVLDIPGGYGKVPIGPVHAWRGWRNGIESWSILDYKGTHHLYSPGTKRR